MRPLGWPSLVAQPGLLLLVQQSNISCLLHSRALVLILTPDPAPIISWEDKTTSSDSRCGHLRPQPISDQINGPHLLLSSQVKGSSWYLENKVANFSTLPFSRCVSSLKAEIPNHTISSAWPRVFSPYRTQGTSPKQFVIRLHVCLLFKEKAKNPTGRAQVALQIPLLLQKIMTDRQPHTVWLKNEEWCDNRTPNKPFFAASASC